MSPAQAKWEAAGKPRGSHPLFLAVVEETRQRAAAKKAVAAEAEAAQAVENAERLERIREQRADSRRESARQARVNQAFRLYHEAESWPRCLEGWPATPAERRADALMRSRGVAP